MSDLSASEQNNSNDGALALKARDGDSQAMLLLVSRLAPVIRRRAAHAASGFSLETEDLAQEGMLGLLDAVKSFDESKGAAFGTYATVCINNRILSAVRALGSKGRIPVSSLVSLDDSADIADIGSDPQEIFARKAETERLMKILDQRLSRYEARVIRLYLAGHGYSAIAALTDSTEKSVGNALQRIKRKLSAG